LDELLQPREGVGEAAFVLVAELDGGKAPLDHCHGIARGDLAEEISALKREPGKDMIAWGGAAFAQSLSNAGLVDEYRLLLQPVALGNGLPLFKGLTAPLRLELVDAHTYSTGSALHVYRPAPPTS
jgi:dihydrofolate reductase